MFLTPIIQNEPTAGNFAAFGGRLQRTQDEAFATCYSDCHAHYCKTFAPYVLIP